MHQAQTTSERDGQQVQWIMMMTTIIQHGGGRGILDCANASGQRARRQARAFVEIMVDQSGWHRLQSERTAGVARCDDGR